ncbi:MAG: hypothetical protein PVI38_03440 [Desulfobacterales bacterium]
MSKNGARTKDPAPGCKQERIMPGAVFFAAAPQAAEWDSSRQGCCCIR